MSQLDQYMSGQVGGLDEAVSRRVGRGDDDEVAGDLLVFLQVHNVPHLDVLRRQRRPPLAAVPFCLAAL